MRLRAGQILLRGSAEARSDSTEVSWISGSGTGGNLERWVCYRNVPEESFFGMCTCTRTCLPPTLDAGYEC